MKILSIVQMYMCKTAISSMKITCKLTESIYQENVLIQNKKNRLLLQNKVYNLLWDQMH